MVRPYRSADAEDLWTVKRGFETTLGDGSESEAKAAAYRDKLDETYRREYLAWVDRCRMEANRSVQVVDAAESGEEDVQLAGYVFVLPASFAYIWDAAVLNEIYVRETYRGTDVGDELMAAALDVAREQELPLDRIVLDVDRSNERARGFYERWDFESWGEMLARDL